MQFWTFVVPIALKVKDKELAEGLDAYGDPLKPISAATRKHRRSEMTPSGKGDPSKGVPDLTGQPPGYLKNQMLMFKADKRSPGDAQLKVVKTLMQSIPDEQLADLAAYWSSVR